jgi:hypothetical protein
VEFIWSGPKILCLDELLPGLAGLQLNQVPDGREHQVVVQERRAHGLFRLQIDQLLEELLAREVGFVPDGIVPGDSGAVGQHVAQRSPRR